MKYRIWRSLDRPASFFGVRGRFAYVFLAVAAGGGLLAGMVGTLTNSLVGMVAFGGVCIADYMFVTAVQGKLSDRALSRYLASRRMPRFIHVKPRTVKSMINNTQP